MSDRETMNREIETSKGLWIFSGIVLLSVVGYLKYFPVRLPGLGLDAGLVLILGFTAVGFAVAFYVGYLQTSTQKQIADGRYRQAEKRLRKGLMQHRAIGPQSFDYLADLILLTRVCRETSQFDDAEKFAQDALMLLKRNDEDWAELCKAERTGEAERLFKYSVVFQQRFTQLRPDALFELAAVQFERGKYDEALRTLSDAATKLDAYMNEICYPVRVAQEEESVLSKDFVLSSMQNDDRRNAEDKLLMSLRKLRDVYRLQALVFSRQKDSVREEEASAMALRACDRAIEISSARINAGEQNPVEYLRRGLNYLSNREFSQALADLNFAFDKSKTKMLRYSCLTNRGECYNRMGKLEAALDDFNAALKLEPKSGLVLLNRSEVYDKLGKKDLAAADKAKAEALGCRHPRLNLA